MITIFAPFRWPNSTRTRGDTIRLAEHDTVQGGRTAAAEASPSVRSDQPVLDLEPCIVPSEDLA